MTVWETLWLALTVLLSLPVAVLLIQVLAARPVGAQDVRDDWPGRVGDRPRVVVLMPAHNEANGVAHAIAHVRAQMLATDRLLVIADNCSDDTAQRAVDAGAEVIVRTDPDLRSKNYALDFALRHLGSAPPEIVVIVDADCELGVGALDALARACAHYGRPVQALYRMERSPDSGLRRRVDAFAWVMRNEVRPLGLMRLGAPCQLMGTGCAFPWAQLRATPIANDLLAEDLRMGLDLAMAGHAPRFLPEVSVSSRFPDTLDAAREQRARWEYGHLARMLLDAPRMLLGSVWRRDVASAALAIDALVPPLAFLFNVSVALVALNLVLAWGLGWSTPLLASAANLLALTLALLLAWARHGRDTLTLKDLVLAPIYALSKVPQYLGFLRRRMHWQRAKRDGE